MQSAEEIIKQILENRGVISAEEKSHFLNPDFERDTHSILLAKDAQRLIDRLIVAIEKKQRIVIFGDYDADGIPATALAMRVLMRFTNLVFPIIPRRRDGYGLTSGSIARILEYNPDVVLCLDNGSVAEEEIADLSKIADVLVIDHHEVAGHRADSAFAIVNPKQSDCKYPFRELCACALTWKVMTELLSALGHDAKTMRWELDLVALSTIADMVPLVGENRVLAKFGLQVMQKSRNAGLLALAQVSGVSLQECDATMIGFTLAPRLNAASRMHSEEDDSGENIPLKLLLAAGYEAMLAEKLQTNNTSRQTLVEKHIEAALEQVNETDPVVVVWNEKWSTGVIGLVASRLVERFQRSAIVLAKEDGVWKGSARAYGKQNVLALMESAKSCFERFGGHEKAGGLTMKTGVDPSVIATLLTKHERPAIEEKKADISLSLDECSLELVDAMKSLEPYGIGNPAPRFAITGVVQSATLMGRNSEHAKITLEQNKRSIPVVIFRFREALPAVGSAFSRVVKIEKNTWNGVERLQLLA